MPFSCVAEAGLLETSRGARCHNPRKCSGVGWGGVVLKGALKLAGSGPLLQPQSAQLSAASCDLFAY